MSPEVSKNAVGALRNLTFESKNIEKIGKIEDVFKALVALLESKSHEVRGDAVEALKNLAFDNPNNQKAIKVLLEAPLTDGNTKQNR